MKRKMYFILLTLLLVVPIITMAAGLVPCGGPGEPVCQLCHWIDQVNLIIKWLVGILMVVFAIIFVSSGIKLVTSAGNAAEMKATKSRITNAIIGLVVVLAAWLLVDFGMKALVNGSFDDPENNNGPWNAIECVAQPESRVVVLNKQDLEAAYGPTDPTAVSNANTSVKADCSPANLQSVGMNATQANVFSCIAEAESTCNNNAQNNTSSARGIFQITRGWNTKCHNLNLPQCQQAVSASGNLNCSTAFGAKGVVKAGMEALANTCNQAASNQSCNAAAALCLYKEEGGYGPWLGTAAAPHTKQRACVAKFAN